MILVKVFLQSNINLYVMKMKKKTDFKFKVYAFLKKC